jgi:hypothetical protein
MSNTKIEISVLSMKADPFRVATASKLEQPVDSTMKGAEDRVLENMTNPLDSDNLPNSKEAVAERGGWLKLGAVAAVSVFAGGLAAAWWYRNTLKKLQQAQEAPPDSHSQISGDDMAE